MVAFNSTRRRTLPQDSCDNVSITSLISRIQHANDQKSDAVGASRRATASVETFRDGRGEIINVRIGRWRTLAAAAERRIVQVRELSCDRVVVRLARSSGGDYRRGDYQRGDYQHSCEIWQLYDLHGRLLASLQTSPDGGFAVISDYQTRQSSRLLRNSRGELETVETWTI